jgi:hypothetical protein
MSRLWNKIKKEKHPSLSPGPASHSAGQFDLKRKWGYATEFAEHHLFFCFERHLYCPQESKSRNFMPTRLIDVGPPNGPQEPRLIATADFEDVREGQSANRRYVALSYCWGVRKNLTATLENITSMQSCIPWSNLPLTITDSIELTRALKIRYLWVDALCIIQNSSDDWKAESVKMADVYGGSFLTISAALAPDVYHGLSTKSWAKGVPLKLEPLYKRAWTLQERLLSPRVLIFGSYDIYWECKTEQIGKTGERIPEALCFRLSPKPTDQDWHNIVKDYTCRMLTNETDKLPALAGLAAAYGQATGKSYMAGLWRQSLLEDLLWEQGTWEDGNEVEPSVPARYRAPSWSWASLDGNISKPSTHKMSFCTEVLSTFQDVENTSFREQEHWIQLKGPAMRKIYELGYVEFVGEKVYAQMDYRARDRERWKEPDYLSMVLCLLLGTTGLEGGKAGYGIMLTIAETEGTNRDFDVYTRVGKFYLKPRIMDGTKDAWDSCERSTFYVI